MDSRPPKWFIKIARSDSVYDIQPIRDEIDLAVLHDIYGPEYTYTKEPVDFAVFPQYPWYHHGDWAKAIQRKRGYLHSLKRPACQVKSLPQNGRR